MKKLLYLYQRAMTYAAWAKSEVWRPLFLLNEIFIVATFMATVLGVKLPLQWVIIAYLVLVIGFILLGYILVKTNFIITNNSISNKENKELMEVVEWIRKQK